MNKRRPYATAFSHRRAVLSSPKRFDLPFRYPPYKGFRWVEKIL